MDGFMELFELKNDSIKLNFYFIIFIEKKAKQYFVLNEIINFI